MKILDATERAVRSLVPLLELGLVAAGDEAAGRQVNPVIESFGSSLERLLWGQRGRSGRGGGWRVRLGDWGGRLRGWCVRLSDWGVRLGGRGGRLGSVGIRRQEGEGRQVETEQSRPKPAARFTLQ